MTLKQQGLIVDYIFKKVSPKYPHIIPDDLRSTIYKILKKNKGAIQDTPELMSIVEDNNALIANVKPRHNNITYATPIVTALGIGRRILKEKYIQWLITVIIHAYKTIYGKIYKE